MLFLDKPRTLVYFFFLCKVNSKTHIHNENVFMYIPNKSKSPIASNLENKDENPFRTKSRQNFLFIKKRCIRAQSFLSLSVRFSLIVY